MKIKYTRYRVKPTRYKHPSGELRVRYQPQYQTVVLGVPLPWKNFDRSLKGIKGLVWFSEVHLAEHYISVVEDRERRK